MGAFLIRRKANVTTEEYQLSMILADSVFEHHVLGKNISDEFNINGCRMGASCSTLDDVILHYRTTPDSVCTI